MFKKLLNKATVEAKYSEHLAKTIKIANAKLVQGDKLRENLAHYEQIFQQLRTQCIIDERRLANALKIEVPQNASGVTD